MAQPMQTTFADSLKLDSPDTPGTAVLRPDADNLADRLLRVTQSLQTTLDIPAMLELFHLQATSNIAMDGLEYTNESLGLEYRIGTRARHTCTYSLKLGELDLGSLLFRRRNKFSEDETVILEKLLCCLLYPLRNALLYQDALTGICNRAAFDDSLRAEINLAGRHRTPLSIVVFDIDHFKAINDQYGHSKGDLAIRAVAQCAQKCARSTDMLFRYGGEEFVMLLRNTDINGARLLADRIRRKVEKLECMSGEREFAMTVSAGVAELAKGDSARQLFERADTALYAAKNGGRNRVCIAD